MSDTSTSTRATRKGHSNAATGDTGAIGASHDTAHNTTSDATPPATLGTSAVLALNSIEVSLPIRIHAGHVIDAAQAAALEAFYRRQFRNNQDANIKARAMRFAAAKTDADREANVALTANEIMDIWLTYQPHVGDTPRQSTRVRMVNEANHRAWIAVATEHNALVDAGQGGLPEMPHAAGKHAPLFPTPRKADGVSDADHKAVLAAFAEKRENFITRFASKPEFAPRIAAELAKVEAEYAAKKTPVAKSAVAVADADDIFA